MTDATCSAALDALVDHLTAFQTCLRGALEAPHGYTSVSMRCTVDGRNARDPRHPFVEHTLWNPPRARTSAHAHLAGSHLDADVATRWVVAKGLCTVLAQSLDARLVQLGLPHSAAVHLCCEGRSGHGLFQMEVLYDTTSDGFFVFHPVPVPMHGQTNSAHNTNRWRVLVERVRALDTVDTPAPDAPFWQVVRRFTQNGVWKPYKRSQPYQTSTPEHALQLCAAIEMPELFEPRIAGMAKVVRLPPPHAPHP